MAKIKKAKRTKRTDQFGKLVRWARKQVRALEADQLRGQLLTDTERQRLTLAIGTFYLDGMNDAAQILAQ